MTMRQRISLQVNGESYELEVPSNRLLLDVLRDDLGLTGARRGCEDSFCGACTVLLNGRPSTPAQCWLCGPRATTFSPSRG